MPGSTARCARHNRRRHQADLSPKSPSLDPSSFLTFPSYPVASPCRPPRPPSSPSRHRAIFQQNPEPRTQYLRKPIETQTEPTQEPLKGSTRRAREAGRPGTTRGPRTRGFFKKNGRSRKEPPQGGVEAKPNDPKRTTQTERNRLTDKGARGSPETRTKDREGAPPQRKEGGTRESENHSRGTGPGRSDPGTLGTQGQE
jgi:hypothetical protein